jgi:hypothetical protein
MAISIFLKTFSVNDSQEQFIEKLHYNMNQLVELGLGEEGPPGIGLRGYPGIPGIKGDSGKRGSLWYNGNDYTTILDPLVGDQYLHETDYAIYSREESSPDVWTKSIDFVTLLNNLVTLDPSSSFVRLNSNADINNTIISFKDANEDPTPNLQNKDTLFLFDFNFDSLDNTTNINIIRSGLVNIYTDDARRYSLIIGDGTLDVATELPNLANSLKIKTKISGNYVDSYLNLSYIADISEITKTSGFRLHTSTFDPNGTNKDSRFYFGSGEYVHHISNSIPLDGNVNFSMHEPVNGDYFSIALTSSNVIYYTRHHNPIYFDQNIMPNTAFIDIGSNANLFNSIFTKTLNNYVYIGNYGQIGLGMDIKFENYNTKLYIDGDIYFDGDADRNINVGINSNNEDGKALIIQAGGGHDATPTTYIGGALYLLAGLSGNGTSRKRGANVYIKGGNGTGGEQHGDIIVAESGGSRSGSLNIGMTIPYDDDINTYGLSVNGSVYFNGNIMLDGSNDNIITMDHGHDNNNGNSLTIKSGDAGNGNYVGGNLYLLAGNHISGGTTGVNGASVYIHGGKDTTGITYGNVHLAVNDSNEARGTVSIGINSIYTNNILSVNGNTEINGNLKVIDDINVNGNVNVNGIVITNNILRIIPYNGTLSNFETAYSSILSNGDMFIITDEAICKGRLYVYDETTPVSVLIKEWDLDNCTPI